MRQHEKCFASTDAQVVEKVVQVVQTSSADLVWCRLRDVERYYGAQAARQLCVCAHC